MADKKHILTYAGLKQYEDELQNLKADTEMRSSLSEAGADKNAAKKD